MNKEEWKEITSEDVIAAIAIFDSEPTRYNKSRSTFLIYNKRDYPAKAIRKIAYKVHFGTDISVDEFTGGDDTARFFQKLGFQAINYRSGLGSDSIDK